MADHGNSYVTVSRTGQQLTYSVKLVNNAAPIRGVRSVTGTTAADGAAVTEATLARDQVK